MPISGAAAMSMWWLCLVSGPTQSVAAAPGTSGTTPSLKPPAVARLDGRALRGSATHVVMPQFPSSALATGTSGVCVVEVVIGISGAMERVTILQAPSGQIGDEVRRALEQWTFKPVILDGRSERAKATGKMAFYFVIRNGKGTVHTPEQLSPPRS